VETNRDRLACDLAVSADSSQGSEDQPVLCEALRGLCGLQIDVRSASADLHSGVMGGVAPNAAHALVAILGSMRDAEGRVLVEGFYDDVAPLGAEERRALATVPDDTEDTARAAGIRALSGEPGFTPRERNWARPTLEVNGLWGGYAGEGLKTIIPCEAHAKVTCRLVPDQEPRRVLALLRGHVEQHAPAEVEVRTVPFAGRSDPYRIPADHPAMVAAGRVLTALYGRAPLLVRSGATVPLPAILRRSLGVYTVGFGFGLRDEHIHAPDEFIRLASLEKGRRAFCMLLEELAR
jgi:acetylornithine deacetylase/succinyl-diaminopimelate desuccinylase-like protein